MRNVVYKSVSFTDLEAYGLELSIEGSKIESARYKGAVVSLESVYKVLFNLGVLNNKHLSVEEKANHRCQSTFLPTFNFRVVGEERKDKKWIRGGYASDEAKMASSRMKDMVQQASNLSK
jgi:hypothetical protein